jgi:hypothetical protein
MHRQTQENRMAREIHGFDGKPGEEGIPSKRETGDWPIGKLLNGVKGYF